MSRTIIRMASLGQEFQNIPFLLMQGKDHRQNAFNKEAALFALSAKTPFSPQNPASQGAFSGIIGGFNASAGAASKTLTFIPRQHQIIFKFFNWRSILEGYST